MCICPKMVSAGRNMSSKRDPSRPRINEETAGILRAAAKVAEQRIKERFPEKRRLSKKTARAGG